MGVNKLNTEYSKLTEQQFSERIEASKEKLYRFAFCYVKNEQEALEIVSEATYKAYLSYTKLKNPEYFDTWISRIVINCAMDHIKRNKKYTYMEDNVVEFSAKEDPVSLEEKWDLYQALDRLKPEDKAFIILKYFEDQRFKDMAEVLSMPENTVKTKLYRILDKLRKHLIKEEEVDLT
ncbi:sigma-70 family RNA polymerase sigma factor [Paenibacillus sp.]|jgi:RNA polymerase sigma-70 factor (ECF subfamily)|uniref:sigma-70 family RNA polymerase sigma factor n=1 Tax=Paenibacillus sp. TaxID=58172 RepID=UPI0028261904|nr:sigma-70 family RNA polymerase sigma factor [Paenibacillus sp.]MDR0267314.1 sigma-70 family RNA polymerase sigma factor [Paenibacillus sp.]